MSTSNFDFLPSELCHDMRQTLQLAEYYIRIDGSGCVAKLRLFSEQFIDQVLNRHEAEFNGTLKQRLDFIESNLWIPAPIIQSLQSIRIAGNSAIHAQKSNHDSHSVARYNKRQLISFLKSALEIAEYYFVEFLEGNRALIPDWQDPQLDDDDSSNSIYRLAFEGDVAAEYVLGHKCYERLQQSYNDKEADDVLRRRLTDAVYWLERAMESGEGYAAVFLAAIYSGLTACPHDANRFEHYLTLIPEGAEKWHLQAVYFRAHKKPDWLPLMKRAGEEGHIDAIVDLQLYSTKQSDIAYWIEKGIENNQVEAHALKARVCFDWSTDAQSVKALLVKGQALGCSSAKFLIGLAKYNGTLNYNQDQAVGHEMMLANYRRANILITPATLFVVTGVIKLGFDVAIEVAESALTELPRIPENEQGDVCFILSTIAFEYERINGSYKGPIQHQKLLQRAVALGCENAKETLEILKQNNMLKPNDESGLAQASLPTAKSKKQKSVRKAAKSARKRNRK